MIKKLYLSALFLLFFNIAYSQELYIVSHPAASLSKNRIEFRNIVMGYENFQYYHNSFELNYGILGNLTLYNSVFYTLDKGYEFLGNYEGSVRYRFHDIDKKNYHVRMAAQSAVVVPVNSNPVVGDKVEYELHPGHKVSFYNFQNDITVPSVDFHTTDNFIFKNDLIITNLIQKFSITGEMGYNINIPKNDFKFGNYIDWSLAMGYLLLPREYKNFNDVNVNLYSESKAYYFEKNEFLGTDVTNSGGFRLDTYLGIQAIFFSSLMTELSYKIPLYSNEYVETQIGKRSTALLISIRYLFFL
ncbi:MAG TPA: hypothetical protein PKD83_00755 [Ignavibacteria bacterium]|nr:hypothetical protein [Ignavibacteria bacterium]